MICNSLSLSNIIAFNLHGYTHIKYIEILMSMLSLLQLAAFCKTSRLPTMPGPCQYLAP